MFGNLGYILSKSKAAILGLVIAAYRNCDR